MTTNTRSPEGWAWRATAWILHALGTLVLYVSGTERTWSFSSAVMVASSGSILFTFGALLNRYGKRLCQPTALTRMRADARRPVVLLRSFRRDEWEIEHSSKWTSNILFHPDYYRSKEKYTFEQALVEILEQVGPVIALGSPAEDAPPLGAARAYVASDRWQAEVLWFVENAALIVVLVDNTPSLQWEISAVSAHPTGLSRLMLVIPPWARGDIATVHPPEAAQGAAKERGSGWDSNWQELRKQFSFLPELPKEAAAIRFWLDGNARVFTGKTAKFTAQLPAIRHAALNGPL